MHGSVAAVLHAGGDPSASQKPNGASVHLVRVSTKHPNASRAHSTSSGPSQLVPSAAHCSSPSHGSPLDSTHDAVPLDASHAPPARVVQSVLVSTQHPNAFGAHSTSVSPSQLVPAVAHASATPSHGSAGSTHIGISPDSSHTPPGDDAQSVRSSTRQPSALVVHTSSVAPLQRRSPAVVHRSSAGTPAHGSTHAALPPSSAHT